jgi:hypothetical protein
MVPTQRYGGSSGTALSRSWLRLRWTLIAALLSAGQLSAAGDAPQSISELVLAMSDPSSDVRINAARALGQLRNPQALPTLVQVTREPAGSGVAREAVAAIVAIGGDDAALALTKVAEDSNVDSTVRQLAATYLAMMGDPRGREQVRALRRELLPEWRHVFLFPPLLYWLAWKSATAAQASRKGWTIVLYGVAGASMLVCASPQWLFSGGDLERLFWTMTLAYPAGTAILGGSGAALIGARHRDLGRAFALRMGWLPVVMWAASAAWCVLLFVAMLRFYGRGGAWG